MSDGATIYHMPLVNNLVMCAYLPPTVVGIHDCTDHMAAGGKKYAEYFSDVMERRFSNLIRNSCIPMFSIFMDQLMFIMVV